MLTTLAALLTSTCIARERELGTTVAALLPPSIFLTMAIIGMTSWVGMARFTRNEFLRIRSLDYVTSAIALGALYGIYPALKASRMEPVEALRSTA